MIKILREKRPGDSYGLKGSEETGALVWFI